MMQRTLLMLALLLVAGASMAQKVVVIDNKMIIDNRAMLSGAITTQAKARTTTATNSFNGKNDDTDIASAASNKTVSYYFEVAKDKLPSNQNWLNAINGCANYDNGDKVKNWRLPTQRELMLIWVLKEAINAKAFAGFTAFDDFTYWSATEDSGSKGWTMSYGSTGSSGKTATQRVRCIRDLTPTP